MKLSITRGTTMSFLLTIQNDDGTIYYLKDGEKLIFGVKFDIESDEYLIKKIIICRKIFAEWGMQHGTIKIIGWDMGSREKIRPLRSCEATGKRGAT